MARIAYIEKRFQGKSLLVVQQARQICEAYAAQGYDLTLRQLYYQFVSRDLLPNKQTEYQRLGNIINDARLAGYLDWDYIVDRTRNLRGLSHWDSPIELIRETAKRFRHEKWKDQPYRIEVWIEKDALVGVLESACPAMDVDFFSCRGYTSQSEVWSAAQRLGEYIEAGQQVVILHLGDHDPSGIDMTRDIGDRLSMFIAQDIGMADTTDDQDYFNDVASEHLEVRRIALNMDQIRRYNPPPNPAKLTDSRARGYINRYGNSSWELDALEPTVLVALIQDAIAEYRDDNLWRTAKAKEDEERKVLTAAAGNWPEVKKFLAPKIDDITVDDDDDYDEDDE